jgi:hypothetical protein
MVEHPFHVETVWQRYAHEPGLLREIGPTQKLTPFLSAARGSMVLCVIRYTENGKSERQKIRR